MPEKNGYYLFRKVGWVIGTISGGIILIGLVAGILARLYIFPVTASKEALSTFEATIKENYISREILALKLDPINKELVAQNKKLDRILTLLWQIRNDNELTQKFYLGR